MKRFFFTTIALAAVAVGCTKSGLLDSPQTYEDPISFEPYTGRAPITKATVAVDQTIYDGFQVIGYEEGSDHAINTTQTPYMERMVYVQKVNGSYEMTTGTTPAPVWRYENAMYWPENKTLSFMAYGLNASQQITDEGTAYNTLTRVNGTYDQYTFKVPTKVANQKDLVISPIMQGQSSVNNPVVVKMYHVLSKVGFKVQLDGSKDVNVIIKDVTLSGTLATEGVFDLEDAVETSTTNGLETVEYKYPIHTASTTKTANVTYSLFDTEYKHTTLGYNDDSNPNGNDEVDYTKAFPAFITRSVEEITSTNTENLFDICKNTTFSTAFLIEAENEGEEEEDKYVDYDPAFITATEVENLATNEDRYMMILPQTKDVTIKVVYQLSGAEEQEATINLSNFEFKAGKAYEFVFTVSTVSVGFGVKVDGWDTYFSADNNDGELTDDEGYFPLIPTV